MNEDQFSKFMVVCMDETLIFCTDEEFHIKHFETVMSMLKDHNLYVSMKIATF